MFTSPVNGAAGLNFFLKNLAVRVLRWIYFVTKFAAGALSAPVFKFVNPDDK